MMVLGLTGSIASGKSTVAGMFSEAGVPVISADGVVHSLYEAKAVPAIAAAFPAAVRDGRVDRAALSAAVLDDPQALARLEAIIHPMVRRRIAARIAEERDRGTPVLVVEIPLLFETAADYPIDRTIVTVAPEAELRRRALERPGMNASSLAAILARQMPQADKTARADFVIDTGQPIEAVRNRVDEIIRACRSDHAR